MGKILIQVWGGLGNQMFVYAAGRALALRTNSTLILDHETGYKLDLYKRQFELSKFKINIIPANKIHSFNYQGGSLIRLFSNKIKRHIPFLNIKIIQENNFEFNDELISNPKTNCYLIGYWQSEKYFKDYSDIIKQDFSIKSVMPDSVLEQASEIIELGNRAVALGVRRYQEVKKFVNVKLTEKKYYLKAMEMISQKIENPVFICFTQDPKWVRENLSEKYEIQFAAKEEIGNEAIEDLYLMKLCKHFIISNSTFYWWGAWLADYESKIIISPNNWLNKYTPNPDWIIID